jgi:hypothetical protein
MTDDDGSKLDISVEKKSCQTSMTGADDMFAMGYELDTPENGLTVRTQQICFLPADMLDWQAIRSC